MISDIDIFNESKCRNLEASKLHSWAGNWATDKGYRQGLARSKSEKNQGLLATAVP